MQHPVRSPSPTPEATDDSATASSESDVEDILSDAREHDATAPASRRVKVVINDSSDIHGPGMTFEVKYLDTLKNVFDRFTAECCKHCKPAAELRFKAEGKRLSNKDTPESVRTPPLQTVELG